MSGHAINIAIGITGDLLVEHAEFDRIIVEQGFFPSLAGFHIEPPAVQLGLEAVDIDTRAHAFIARRKIFQWWRYRIILEITVEQHFIAVFKRINPV